MTQEITDQAGIDERPRVCRTDRSNCHRFVQQTLRFAVPGPIEINGDEATVSCLCYEAARGPGEAYYRNSGVWSDRLRRTDAGWVFTSRTYRYLWLDLTAFSGDVFPV